MAFERPQIHGIQHRLVGRFENDGWDGRLRETFGLRGFKCLDPPSETETPAIAWVKPGKLQLRTRGHKVVTPFFTERQKIVSHYRTKLVSASIVGMGSTAAIAVEASLRISTTGGKFLAKDILFGHIERAWSIVKSLPVCDWFDDTLLLEERREEGWVRAGSVELGYSPADARGRFAQGTIAESHYTEFYAAGDRVRLSRRLRKQFDRNTLEVVLEESRREILGFSRREEHDERPVDQ